jgi:hypothetical protein
VALQAEVARLLVRPAVQPDGGRIPPGGFASSLWLLDVTDPQKTAIKKIETARWTVSQPREQANSIRCLCISPDGRWVYAAGPHTQRDNYSGREYDGVLLTIEPNDMYCYRNLTHAGDPYDMAVRNDGQVFISSGGKKPGIYAVSGSGRYIAGWAGEPWQVGLALAHDRRMLYVGNARGTSPSVSCLPLGDSPPRARPSGNECAIDPAPGARGELTVSPDGRYLFCDTGRLIALEPEVFPPSRP